MAPQGPGSFAGSLIRQTIFLNRAFFTVIEAAEL